jgi:hypothetical protein
MCSFPHMLSNYPEDTHENFRPAFISIKITVLPYFTGLTKNAGANCKVQTMSTKVVHQASLPKKINIYK